MHVQCTYKNYVCVHTSYCTYVMLYAIPNFRGIVTRRWHPVVMDTRCDMEVILVANHVQVQNDQKSIIMVTEDMVISLSVIFYQ